MSDLVGGGGVFSTVLDLLKWGADFDDGRVGSRETRQRQVTVGTLRDGSALTYAAGLTIDTFAGIGFVEHGGSLAGYRAHFLRVPSERVAVAVTCNASTANAGALARAVTRLYLGGTAGQAVARADSAPLTPTRASVTHRALSLDSAALASYGGRYRSDELDATWTLAVSGDTLVLRRPHLAEVRLRPEEVDAFTFGSTTLRFTRAGSAVDGFTVHAGRAEGMRFERRP
jgi:hypothetical protein